VIDDQAEEACHERPQEVDEAREDNAHQAIPGGARTQHALNHELIACLVEQNDAKEREE
jgi:hypothetical protein